jgi:xylulokinase
MSVVLGVDIGTYEAKGVLVDEDGRIVASHRRPPSWKIKTIRP